MGENASVEPPLLPICVLGALEVTRDGEPVRLQGGQQRRLLAALATHANDVVSADRLVEMLWGGELAATVAGAPETLGKFNPGLGPQDFALFGGAKFVPKGSDLVFNMHYTSVGKAATDRSKVGLVLAKNPPKLRYLMHNGPTGSNLAIPAGAVNAQVVSEMTTQVDMQLVYLQPHMHLRGKDYELRLAFPNGKTETIFKAKWDFNWQIGYELQPITLPKGTRIIGVAHYDN